MSREAEREAGHAGPCRMLWGRQQIQGLEWDPLLLLPLCEELRRGQAYCLWTGIWVLPGSQGLGLLLEQAQKAGQDVGGRQAPRLLLLA